MRSEPDPRIPLTPLTMAILLALADEDCHGYALMQRVEAESGGGLKPGTGSLYAALERLMDDGLIAEVAMADSLDADRRRKSYRITEGGRALARAEAARMLDVLRIARARKLGPQGDPLLDAGS